MRTALLLHRSPLALGVKAVLRRDVDAPVSVLKAHLAYLCGHLSDEDREAFAVKDQLKAAFNEKEMVMAFAQTSKL